MIEENLRKCKDCGEIKPRILVGKFDHKNKRYHDGTGKAWNGSRCPSCHKEKAKLNMKVMRAIKS